MYPYLTSVEPVLKAAAGRPEISIKEHPTGLHSICYYIAEKDTFDDPLRKECRGLVYDPVTLEVVLRPYHKFFGLGEKPETLPGNVRWDKVERVREKLDGTMVFTGVYKDAVIAHTKRSVWDKPLPEKISGLVEELVRRLGSVTVIFEHIYSKLTDDLNMVLEYDADDYVLLDVRCNDTGAYIKPEYYSYLAVTRGVRLPTISVISSMESLLFYAEHTVLPQEGVVLCVDGDFIKVKTKWYIARHHLLANLTERNIARLVLSESIDDAIAYLTTRFGSETTSVITDVAHKVESDFNRFVERYTTLYVDTKDREMRDLVKELTKEELWFVSAQRKPHDVPWVDCFTRNHLTDYSTEPLLAELGNSIDPD